MMEESERSGTKRKKTLSCLQDSNSALKRSAHRRKRAGEFLAAVIAISQDREKQAPDTHCLPLSLRFFHLYLFPISPSLIPSLLPSLPPFLIDHLSSLRLNLLSASPI